MELEKITKEMNEHFSEQRGIYVPFNVYLTPSSEGYAKTEHLTKTFEEVHETFLKEFKLNFKYKFSTIQKPITSVEMIADAYKKGEKIVDHHTGRELNADDLTVISAQYSAASPLDKKLSDYQAYIDNLPDKNKKEMDCVLTGTEPKYKGTTSVCWEYGVAPLQGSTFVVTINRKSKNVPKTILHEISHCFGADHSIIPFSIMKAPTNTSLKWWDPWSKKAVKNGIEEFLN